MGNKNKNELQEDFAKLSKSEMRDALRHVRATKKGGTGVAIASGRSAVSQVPTLQSPNRNTRITSASPALKRPNHLAPGLSTYRSPDLSISRIPNHDLSSFSADPIVPAAADGSGSGEPPYFAEGAFNFDGDIPDETTLKDCIESVLRSQNPANLTVQFFYNILTSKEDKETVKNSFSSHVRNALVFQIKIYPNLGAAAGMTRDLPTTARMIANAVLACLVRANPGQTMMMDETFRQIHEVRPTLP